MPFTSKSKTVGFALILGVGAMSVALAALVEILLAMPVPRWVYGVLGLLILLPLVLSPRPAAGAAAAVFLNGNLALVDSLVFRHRDDGPFNSDWGVVQFKDGRVVRVEFLPD